MKITIICRFRVLGAAAIFIAATTGLPHTARAHDDARIGIADFRTIDTDRDAKLDRHELLAAASRDFDRLDVDRDGYLTRGEIKRTHSASLLLPLPGRLSSVRTFAAADTDHDEKIDRHEYEVAIVNAYMTCDRNHDGTIKVSDLRHCRL